MVMKDRSAHAQRREIRSWRDYPPMNVSLGNMLHNRTGTWRFVKPIYEDKVPACQNACPAGNDIEAWIKLLQKGEAQKAYWHLKREQPFPSILGRVCFGFCQTACNRHPFDGSVGIRALERFVGDQVPLSLPYPDLPEYNGKSLAVVGSGPAGMSAAYYGRLLGFHVTLFEALEEMGGILRVGIPSYRLPRDIVAQEFLGLRNMGITLRPDTAVGKGVTLEALRQGFDYLFLATGVHGSRRLDLDGEDRSPRIMSGLAMLQEAALGRRVDLGRRVVVVGGGNTAVDAARTALRLGCRVTLLYRRSEQEMPAHAEEIREALEEGVVLRTLAAPERIMLNEDNTVRKLICCEMALGPPDESGRRRPVKKEGASFELETDAILTGIGEVPVFDYLDPAMRPRKDTLQVDEGLRVRLGAGKGARVFAGGDIIPIPHTVVHAVASGKKAAVAMDCHRTGRGFTEVLEKIRIGDGSAVSFSRYMGWAPLNPVPQDLGTVVDSEKMVYDYFHRLDPIPEKVREPEARKHTFEPYRETLGENGVRREAERCFHCGRCTECDNCLVFCPDVSVLPGGEDRFGYAFDYDYCKGCGICFAECPRYAITMVDEETPIETPYVKK